MYIAVPTRTTDDPNSAADINQLQANIDATRRMGMAFFILGTVNTGTDLAVGLLPKATVFTSIRGKLTSGISNTACVFQLFNNTSLVGTVTIPRGSTNGTLGSLRTTSGSAWTTLRLRASKASASGSIAKDLAVGVEFQ
jgi:hypothetical protein